MKGIRREIRRERVEKIRAGEGRRREEKRSEGEGKEERRKGRRKRKGW